MNAISFMSANFVAKELGYGAADEWGPFDSATNAAFEPLETFGDKFEALLDSITAIGFDTLDLWFGHLNWRWATPEHVAIARDALERNGIRVVSLAGSIGETAAEAQAACRLASSLDVDLIAGPGDLVRRDRDGVVAALEAEGVRFALENHPERTPSEILDAIGDHEMLGAAVDTGWWATQRYDPVAAIHVLAGRTLPKTSACTAPTGSARSGETTNWRVRTTSPTSPPSSRRAPSAISQHRRAWTVGSGST